MSSITQWNLIRIMLCSTLVATIHSACPKPPPLTYALPNADKDTYNEGDTVKYSCSEGYSSFPSISNIATCNADGNWTTFPEAFCRSACPKPPPLTYALPNADKDTYNEGDTVKYSCSEGYSSIPSISNIATCAADGNWTTFPEAFCRKLDCGIPDILQNGKIEFLATVFGSNASYKCIEGYKLLGSDTRYCSADGKWNGTVPSCNRTCPEPPTLQFAIINTTTSQIAHYYPQLTTVVYSCISGYIPNFLMPLSSTCQSNFTWSKIEQLCKRISCGSPGEVENGAVEMIDDKFQSKAFFVCNSGYKLVGNPYRECLEEGIWTGSVPTCHRSCPDPPVPKYGQIIEMPDTQYFPVDVIIVYKCIPGYKYNPFVLPITQCLEGFTWSNINEFCKKVICGEPERVKNGNLLITGTDFGSIAVYSCSKGYNLIGNSLRKCTEDGVWGGSPPSCQTI